MKYISAYLKPLLCFPHGIGVQGVILSLSLGAITFTGDFCVAVSHNDFAKAVCDNLTHGLIGFFSWLIVSSDFHSSDRILESLSCAFFASVIDVDHFVAARSLDIKDAVTLPRRPFMHCTTLVVIISIFIHAVVKTCQFTHVTLKRIGWVFFVATISHHIRDGSRRGLWLWPLPYWTNRSSGLTVSTRPISKVLYLISTIALPHILKYVIVGDAQSPPKTGNLFIV